SERQPAKIKAGVSRKIVSPGAAKRRFRPRMDMFESVYTCSDIQEGVMPQFAKVFQSGNSQAVRPPRDFRFEEQQRSELVTAFR
ncbi:hypothetical protein ACUSIJ_24640, partial [Pseudochelatococcus sp. B33]